MRCDPRRHAHVGTRGFENNAQAGLLMQMFITYAQHQRADPWVADHKMHDGPYG